MRSTIISSVVTFCLIGSVQAADKAKSPKQILGGKAAATSRRAGNFYNGTGSFAGRTSSSGKSTSIYNGQDSLDGRIDHTKNGATTSSWIGNPNASTESSASQLYGCGLAATDQSLCTAFPKHLSIPVAA
jgi:hypothetical protein